MNDILALMACLSTWITSTRVRQMSQIVLAILSMTGRVTMLGLSRWTEAGGSYRTVQRFFASTLPWGALFWVFFQHCIYGQRRPLLVDPVSSPSSLELVMKLFATPQLHPVCNPLFLPAVGQGGGKSNPATQARSRG